MYSRQASELVIDLLDASADPHNLTHTYDRYPECLITAVTYGRITRRDGDPVLDRLHEIANIINHVITAEKAALLRAFPFLEKLPAWCFSRDYALLGRSRELCQQLLNEPFKEVKEQMAADTASQSLVADFLSQADDDADEDMIKAIALTGSLAGSAALSRGEDQFPDASRFDPNRHLTMDGQLKDRHTGGLFVFGFGRRICPGRWFAMGALWIGVVVILSVLRIDHARDLNGKRIEVKLEFTTGVSVRPQDFACSFESINAARDEQLRAMMTLK
ncbi:cytochrome p450 [Rhizopogon vesiculosus]|uniref:Cytochrome p450 n=1 Tax=Rhizopogon vesiculosus TaxID=180088 RepID=A0A1J8Q7M6_9AGAM|nr:cytochrome p450 [Rhizopogon vesiculosus]